MFYGIGVLATYKSSRNVTATLDFAIIGGEVGSVIGFIYTMIASLSHQLKRETIQKKKISEQKHTIIQFTTQVRGCQKNNNFKSPITKVK